MDGKKFLVHLDILGFQKLPDKIAKLKAMETSVVRNLFLSVITEKIEALEKEKLIILAEHSKDDWLLIIERPEHLFLCIQSILSHNTGFHDFQHIPLEIGIGIAEYGKELNNDSNVVIEDDTITFLKSTFLYDYHQWFKHEHGKSVESTFILVTESAFQELIPYSQYIWNIKTFNSKKLFITDEDGIKSRARVYEFLDKIGHSGSNLYDNIDTLYVPPREYTDIKKLFLKKRIVFITGTQEYGKTYTAVRLMWEYFLKGYEPRWYKGREKDERTQVREKLEQIKSELKPKHVVYFEDPFGKVRYEKRESLEREMGTILDCVTQVDDAYVIITSREEVFKEFSKEKISQKMLANFERKLNIQKPSYDTKKRIEMTIRWAKKERCSWIKNRRLKYYVTESLSDDSVLPTPLSIRDFALSTVQTNNLQALETKIQEKSIETERAFAKEIQEMSDDKFIFLFFPLITSFEDKFIRDLYEEMIKEFKIENAWDFITVYKWFSGDKISTINKYIGFSHPSYSQAIEILLTEEEALTDSKKRIINRILHRLTEKEESVSEVTYFIDNNFSNIPNSIRNELLLNISKWEESAYMLALIIGDNFYEIPYDIRNNLLSKIVGYGYQVAGAVGEIIANNFNSLPSGLRNKLIIRVLDWEESADIISQSINMYLERIPKETRDIVLKKMAGWSISAEIAASILERKFEDIPSDIRDSTLEELLQWAHLAEPIVRIVQMHFDEITEAPRYNLLFRLGEIEEAATSLVLLVKNYFNKILPIPREKLLLKLADYDESSKIVAETVHANFLNISKNVRNRLLLLLSSKYYAVFQIIKIVDYYFEKIPGVKRKRILLKLAEWDIASDAIKRLIHKNQKKISGETRGELLLAISDMDNRTIRRSLIPDGDEYINDNMEDIGDDNTDDNSTNIVERDGVFFKVELFEDTITSAKNSIYYSKDPFIQESGELISDVLDELEQTIDGMVKFMDFAEYDYEQIPITTIYQLNLETNNVENVLNNLVKIYDQLNVKLVEKENEPLLNKISDIMRIVENIVQAVYLELGDVPKGYIPTPESIDSNDDYSGSE
jgi:hypothetical protein